MNSRGRTRMLDGVSGNRWFPGIVTALVLTTSFVVGGLVWASTAPSQAVDTQAPVLSIQMQIPDPASPSGRSDWIELESIQWTVSWPMTDGLPSGDLVATQFTIVKKVDASTPKLYEACTKGQHLSEVTIQLARAGGSSHPYMTYTMKDVMISGYSIGGSSQESAPTEQISFTFTRITIDYAGGDTVTHECGHWLGLYHSYQASCTTTRGGNP